VLPELDWPTPTPGAPKEPASSTKATPSAGGWTVQRAQLLGTSDNSVGAIAGSSPADVWAVGDYLPDAAKSNQDATLNFAEHYNGRTWTVVPTPDAGPNFDSFYGVAASPEPGSGSNILGGVTAIDGQLWAAGIYDDGGSRLPLLEHRG
jgi:hypothetical protein